MRGFRFALLYREGGKKVEGGGEKVLEAAKTERKGGWKDNHSKQLKNKQQCLCGNN